MLIQTLTPNPRVACRPGWCLTYVSDAFGLRNIPHTNYPTAMAAWNASVQRRDLAFPAGVYVPLWFSLRDEPAGHVAILSPDGSVWSSSHPSSTTPIQHPSLGALINYYAKANPLTYLGWSEDIGGTKVITNDGDYDMIADTDNEYARWHKLAFQVRKRSLSREEFKRAAVGRTWLNAIETLSDNDEADSAQRVYEVGKTALSEDWQGQLTRLQKTVQEKDDAIAKAAADTAAALAAREVSSDPFNVPGRGSVTTPTAAPEPTPEPAKPTEPAAPKPSPLVRLFFALFAKFLARNKKA